jgi:hypothetical protein
VNFWLNFNTVKQNIKLQTCARYEIVAFAELPRFPLATNVHIGYTSLLRLRKRPQHSHANVAQLVEQRTRNAQVSGSSPLIGSMKNSSRSLEGRLFFVFPSTIHLKFAPNFPSLHGNFPYIAFVR